MASRVILCLNCGSSSLKFALYRIDGGGEEHPLAQGAVELNDEQVTRLWIRTTREKVEKTGSEISSPSTPPHALPVELKRLQLPHPDAVRPRRVHARPRPGAPARTTASPFH